ncbi:MAG: hypothetical protein K2X93_08140 [Candidatus Obscuribacterales bacterium]|nr:hypothetical protein [Candidatus Obscuribacterales bacterium]
MSRKLKKSFVVALVIAGSAGNFSDAFAKNVELKSIDELKTHPVKNKDLWVIAQTADSVNKQSVCISKGAIKFSIGEISVVASAPDWKATVVNERAKICCEVALSDLHGLKDVRPLRIKSWVATNEKLKSTAFAAQQVSLVEGAPDRPDESTKSMILASSTKIPVEPGALHVLERIYETEGLTGIPLSLKSKSAGGEQSIDRLATKWCLNRELTPNVFEVPNYLTMVSSVDEVETSTAVRTNRDRRQMIRSSRGPKKPRPGASSSTTPAK